MAKGRRITITDMQMNVLRGYDRDLRQGGQSTSGLLRNAPVDKWKAAPGLKPLSGVDRRIAALRAELEA
jgi:hypothetical protein